MAKGSGGTLTARFRADSQTQFRGGRVRVGKLQVGDRIYQRGNNPAQAGNLAAGATSTPYAAAQAGRLT